MAQASKTRKVFDNRYEIMSIVGRGHCSVVYHARHVMSPTAEVALKVLLSQRDNTSNAERLRREALALVSARHRYVIRLDDFHSVGELCYLSMEYAPESDLRKFTAKHGKTLNPALAEAFLLQLCEAVSFIHGAGIIHRDVKPDNFLVINEREIRLGDFGVAVLPGMESTLEELQVGVGTMNYMAPEVLAGIGYEPRSDIYALGVSFYELLSGVHPFESAPMMQQLEIRENGRFPALSKVAPKVPKRLAEAVMKAMSYDPEERFSTAEEMAAMIRGRSVSASSSAPAQFERGTDSNVVPFPIQDGEGTEIPDRSPEADSRESRSESNGAGIAAGTMYGAAPGNGFPSQGPSPEAPLGGEHAGRSANDEVSLMSAEDEGRMTDNDGGTSFAPSQIPTSPKRRPAADKKGRQTHTVDLSSRANRSKTVQIDRETVEKVRKQGAAPKGDLIPNNVKRKFIGALAVVLFLTFLVCSNIFLKQHYKMDMLAVVTNGTIESPSATPEPDDDAPLQYPHLPRGVYSGSINGFLPNTELPLSILSLPSKQKLVVLVGLEGWSPAVVSLEKIAGDSADGTEIPLKIAANGYLIELAGHPENGAITGTFRNLVTGDEGTWSVTRSEHH